MPKKKDKSADEHSPIGASSMYRWSACPGSVRLSKGLESKSSKDAIEGTRAHGYAADILTGKLKVTDKTLFPGLSASSIDAVKVYVEYVDSQLGNRPIVWIEKSFDLSAIYPGCYGTGDTTLYHEEVKLLQVIDYKNGKGIPVEVWGNKQLRYYGLGAYLALKDKYDIEEVELVIVQPRCNHDDGPIRKEKISAFELIEFAEELRSAAEATAKPNAPLVPAQNKSGHCRFCPALPICPAVKNKAQALAKREFKPISQGNYDPAELSETLSFLDTIEQWAKAVRTFAYEEASNGRMPPGFKLVSKRNNRNWSASEDELELELCALGGFNKDDLYEKPKLKSVPQIEEMIKPKSAFMKTYGSLVRTFSSGTTLVPESDNRKSAITLAKDEFKPIKGAE